MTVLYILVALVTAFILYGITEVVNDKLYSKFKFEIFNVESFTLIAITNVILLFGVNFYQNTLASGNGDILNGILMIAVGAIIYISLIIYNIKHTNFKVGFFTSILQLLIYAAFTLPAVFIVLGILGNAKPVYRIDD